MFKPNPKARVALKFAELFGKGLKPVIAGARTVPSGLYYTTLTVNGRVVADALHRDWRKSYKLLLLEVEKLYADGAVIS